jgi:hypothetical protein
VADEVLDSLDFDVDFSLARMFEATTTIKSYNITTTLFLYWIIVNYGRSF